MERVSTEEAFRAQIEQCVTLGSPFMARLTGLAAERLDRSTEIGALLLDWPGNPSHWADALPLRFAGALHALVLAGHPLGAVYPPHTDALSDDAFWAAVLAALESDADAIRASLSTAPQTNEVRRASALTPGFLMVAERFGLPLRLSELGASGGLNLCWDLYGHRFGDLRWGPAESGVALSPDWTGPPPPTPPVAVVERRGCDLNPLRVTDPAEARRLLAFLWPDQSERLARTRAAIDIAAQAELELDRADAAPWLEARLAAPVPGTTHVVYHSIAWQYFDAETALACRAALEAAGARAAADAPLAWLRMEADGVPESAALRLTLWPGGEDRLVGRTGFHGQWVHWFGEAGG